MTHRCSLPRSLGDGTFVAATLANKMQAETCIEKVLLGEVRLGNPKLSDRDTPPEPSLFAFDFAEMISWHTETYPSPSQHKPQSPLPVSSPS